MSQACRLKTCSQCGRKGNVREREREALLQKKKLVRDQQYIPRTKPKRGEMKISIDRAGLGILAE